MRRVFVIAWVSLRRTARDRQALITLLFMPMLLIAILGTALGPMMTAGRIDPFPVLVVNQDTPVRPPLPPNAPAAAAAQVPYVDLGRMLVDEVLAADTVARVLTVSLTDDLDAARAAVTAGRAAAVIHVPAGFSADVLAGRATQVNVWADAGRPTRSGIVEQVVRSFTEGVVARAGAARLAAAQGVTVAPVEPVVAEVPAGTRRVSAMQYYAAGMAVMFMLMTALARAKELIEEREAGTLARLLSTPISRTAILSGQVLGTVAILLTQFLILLAGTRIAFGVYWGPWPAVLALGAAFALAAAGVGTAAAGLFRTSRAADAAVGLVGQLLGALSGSMLPLYAFPDALLRVARLIPNYWALQGFLDQMSGAAVAHAGAPVAVLAMIALATGALGAWRLATR